LVVISRTSTPGATARCHSRHGFVSHSHDLLWTSERHPSHESEPGALDVAVEGERDRNFESPHDGEADAVREAQAGVIYSLG